MGFCQSSTKISRKCKRRSNNQERSIYKRNAAYKERITSFKKFLLQTPEKGLNFVCFSTLGGSRNGITPEQDRTG